MVPIAYGLFIGGPFSRKGTPFRRLDLRQQLGLSHPTLNKENDAMSKRSRYRKRIPKLESLKQINLNAAGIDIGSTEIFVCVPEDRTDEPVRSFETFTCELNAIADWLSQCQIDTVAMESTGIYWIPLFDVLTERGLEVFLVNAREIKNVPGRKSDVFDCQWIQQLHTYDLLKSSFRPDEEICRLRSLVRHRDNLIKYRSAHIQHMQKALHLMNLQLDNVITDITDITGLTGMRIIRAIVDGQRNPLVLAEYRDPHCKNSKEVIAKSLEGTYTDEHLFQLKQALQLYDFYNQLILEADEEIEIKYCDFPAKANPTDKPMQPQKRSNKQPVKNEPLFPLRESLYKMCGIDLTLIDGINALTVQTVISEVGLDMSKWKTSKHFASWLGLCPNNEVSGGKVLKTKTKKTSNRANAVLRMAAQSLYRSDCALGTFFRRMRAKHGSPKAITATAHKLVRIIYIMLRDSKEYVDIGADYYEAKYRQRVLKSLNQRANKLGYELVPISVS
jgi:transposase